MSQHISLSNLLSRTNVVLVVINMKVVRFFVAVKNVERQNVEILIVDI
jgi:hypothetical protein